MTNAKTLPKLVGERVRRREDPRLISGLGTYVDDIKLPGMLHMSIVRSTHAHARITNIDDYFKNIEEMKKLEAEAAKLAEQAKKAEEEEKARLRKMEEDMMKEQGGGGSTPPPADPKKAEPAKPDAAKSK